MQYLASTAQCEEEEESQALAVRGLCTCLAFAGFFVRDDAPYTTLHRPSNAAIILWTT